MNRQIIYQAVFIGMSASILWNVAVTGINWNNKNLAVNNEAAVIQAVRINPFTNIDVEARSFLVFDIDARGAPRVIAERESTMQWPLASLAKLMTALVARDRLATDEIITVKASAISEYGDDGFLVGEKFSRDDLLDVMLLRSSNDAAIAIAEHLGKEDFIKMMNGKAKELGMTETYFINPSGLDASKVVSGAYSSAKDLATLLVHILKTYPEMLAATSQPELSVTSLSGKTHKYENTNKIVDRLPQLIGSKTGLTDIAGGNLAVVVDVGVNHPAGIIVLGSSEETRFNDVLNLYAAMIKWFQDYNEGR
jgi:D-alanyl-D-alanine carboxypeptidase (penicillin-binding protein 5/6)